MKTLLLLAVIMSFGLLETHGDLADFAEMIFKVTGKEPIFSYGFYGCYCGYGGQGTPKDATDWGQVICEDSPWLQDAWRQLEGRSHKIAITQTRENKRDRCKTQLCECDKAAAYCFARNEDTYSRKYQFYNNLLCTGQDVQC